jgi:AcrR family transcriptional regulator
MVIADMRRRVLDASLALVAEHGVRAVSFREVARRAGVSHQAPYHHFGNTVGILQAIAQEGFAALTAAMASAAAAAGRDPRKALTSAGIAYVTFARTHVGHFRVMFQRTLVELHDGEAPVPQGAQTYAMLVQLCAAAHHAGHGRGLSVDAISHLAWSTVHGLAMLLIERTLEVKAGDDEAVVAQVIGGLARLLAPAPAARRSSRTRRAAPSGTRRR